MNHGDFTYTFTDNVGNDNTDSAYDTTLGSMLDNYQLMIAMYTNEEPVLADGRDYTMWQYTAKGRIVGVNGFVDKSRFMGDHELRDIRFRH